MSLDFDTFLTTLSCVIDDLYQTHVAPHKPTRPGPKPRMSDPEVLTLTLLNQWAQVGSQRALVRLQCKHAAQGPSWIPRRIRGVAPYGDASCLI